MASSLGSGPEAGSPADAGRRVIHHAFSRRRRTIWEYTRVQLGGALAIDLGAIWITCGFLDLDPLIDEGVQISVLGSVLALFAGYAAFRRTSLFPGVKASFHILPAFALTFGLVLATLFFLRLDYSRAMLLAGFAPTVLWFYFIYFKLQRLRTLTIAIVPAGETGELTRIPGVEWVTLDRPDPSLPPFDTIVADLRAEISSDWERFLADRVLGGTLVLDRKQIHESLTGKVAIDHLSENNLGSLVPADVYARCKRVIDAVAAAIALLLLSPLFFGLAVLIKAGSRGPVFFVQERMGYRGRSFQMVKFRTMAGSPVQDGDQRAFAITAADDRRITKAGRWLRRYRLDELPQIFNVLKGEMSWIGPRPEALPLSQWYESELPFYRYRHIVRPGITGWAQVKQGHVADVLQVRSKLQYDFYYIKNFSIWLDILIVFGTARTIMNGHGAR